MPTTPGRACAPTISHPESAPTRIAHEPARASQFIGADRHAPQTKGVPSGKTAATYPKGAALVHSGSANVGAVMRAFMFWSHRMQCPFRTEAERLTATRHRDAYLAQYRALTAERAS